MCAVTDSEAIANVGLHSVQRGLEKRQLALELQTQRDSRAHKQCDTDNDNYKPASAQGSQ